ncbi:MAG TPA: glycerate kinase [Tepidisphaeraceae bacterium]
MKIVIAPDKFKGCLSAPQVCAAIAAGVRAAAASEGDAEIDLCPLADGGEGTVTALVSASGGKLVSRRVTGPLAEMKVDAVFGILGDGKTAVIEMAAASGLALLKPEDRNPMNTTTFGTGELLLAAAEMGVEQVILGIGGSATTDGGIGCAQACGLPIILDGGQPVSPTEPLTGRDLPSVLMVKHGRGSAVERLRIRVACDVTNPLFGRDGAARVFGPQKGASPEDVKMLDGALRGLAERTGKLDAARTPGAGAAGGLGFGMLAFFGAELRSGIDIVMEAIHFRDRLAGADLCLTGEGKLDAQSGQGKVISGVSRLCAERKIPCIALAGAIADDFVPDHLQGLTASFAIADRPMSLEESSGRAAELLARAAEQIVRTFMAGRSAAHE